MAKIHYKCGVCHNPHEIGLWQFIQSPKADRCKVCAPYAHTAAFIRLHELCVEIYQDNSEPMYEKWLDDYNNSPTKALRSLEATVTAWLYLLHSDKR